MSNGCYFPIEYQGTFLIQTQASGADGGSIVTYSEITIEADAIPPWGRCHKRRGNNVILKDSTGAEDCMRCFHLTMKTPNVIQLHTEGLFLKKSLCDLFLCFKRNSSFPQILITFLLWLKVWPVVIPMRTQLELHVHWIKMCSKESSKKLCFSVSRFPLIVDVIIISDIHFPQNL